ncbi:MAG: BatD family protein [Lentisphaerales bacterium]|nr:BatD family protein [Lentisphaerales bacterium]
MRLLLFLVIFTNSLLAQEFYKYEISPALVMEGDNIALKFTAKRSVDFHKNFPKVDALSYRGASRGQQIINNYRESSVTLNFLVKKSGSITIPALEVTLDGKIYKCKERTFKAWPAKINTGNNEVIQTRILYNGKEELPEKIYTGQSFTVDYEVSVLGTWRYLDRNTFNDYRPSIKAENLNLQVQDQDLNRYIYFKEFDSSRVIDNVPYRTRTYRYTMSPVKSGHYNFRIEHNVIAIQRTPGLPRNRSKEVEFNKTQPLNIIPIPAPPANMNFLDLTGKWQVSAKTSKPQTKTGHTFELIISVKGSGGDKTRLSAPNLEIPGFEIEPRPDINTDSNPATIKYAMRALHPKAKIPELVFGTFDHELEKFVEHPVKADIKITGSALKIQKPVVDPAQQMEIPLPTSNNSEYMPPLVSLNSQVSRPLLFNISPLWYIAVFTFPLLFLGLYLTLNRDQTKKAKTGKKRASLIKEIRNLCKTIDQNQDQSLVNSQVLPLLAEYNNLPQGTTADELIDHLEDKELAKMLQQVSHSEFLPTSTISNNLKTITAKLAKLTVILLSFSPAFLKAQSQTAFELYRTAQYEAAAEAFCQELSTEQDDASLHANLGNCYFMQENYSAALASYETASRLSPANSQIRSALNATLKIMKISREQELFAIKDRMRPDQWLKVAIATWILFWGIMTIQLWRKVPGKRWTATWGGAVVCLCLLIYASQSNKRYKSGQYLIKHDTSLLQKPEAGAVVDKTLPKGDIVIAQQQEGDYLKVIVNESALWLHLKDTYKVW